MSSPTDYQPAVARLIGGPHDGRLERVMVMWGHWPKGLGLPTRIGADRSSP
jgi:hypothetical protein